MMLTRLCRREVSTHGRAARYPRADFLTSRRSALIPSRQKLLIESGSFSVSLFFFSFFPPPGIATNFSNARLHLTFSGVESLRDSFISRVYKSRTEYIIFAQNAGLIARVPFFFPLCLRLLE